MAKVLFRFLRYIMKIYYLCMFFSANDVTLKLFMKIYYLCMFFSANELTLKLLGFCPCLIGTYVPV